MLTINDSHVHYGSSYHINKRFSNDSPIQGYHSKISELNNSGFNLEKFLVFSQPRPYDFLLKYRYLPVVNFEKINDEVGNYCLKSEKAFFAVFVDVRDYNAVKEIRRCALKYNPKAVKLHFASHLSEYAVLEDYGIIDVAINNNLPLIIHQNAYSSDLINILSRHNGLKIIIPHLGFLDKKLIDYVKNNDDFGFDTSSFIHPTFKASLIDHYNSIHNKFLKIFTTPNNLSVPQYLRMKDATLSNISIDYGNLIETMVSIIGSKKIFFGSDWSPIKEQIDIISSSGISESDKENIFSNNFDKLFEK